MDISSCYADNEVDPIDVPEDLPRDENGYLKMENVYDIKRGGQLTRWECETGKRIIWLYYPDGTVVY